MDLFLQYKIKSNLNYVKYLRENSNWYKYLNRNPIYFKDFEARMKNDYKLNIEDKIDNFSKNIDRISKIIDIFS